MKSKFIETERHERARKPQSKTNSKKASGSGGKILSTPVQEIKDSDDANIASGSVSKISSTPVREIEDSDDDDEDEEDACVLIKESPGDKQEQRKSFINKSGQRKSKMKRR